MFKNSFIIIVYENFFQLSQNLLSREGTKNIFTDIHSEFIYEPLRIWYSSVAVWKSKGGDHNETKNVFAAYKIFKVTVQITRN